MAVASLWRIVLRRAMGKWRSKSAYSRAPDDAACSPDDTLAAAGGCTTLLPAAGVKGSINAAGAAGGADERLLGNNGSLGWEAAASAPGVATPADRHSDGAGSNNGRAPMHNGSAVKANGHPAGAAAVAADDAATALAMMRPPGVGGGAAGDGDGPPGASAAADSGTADMHDFAVDEEVLECGLGPCAPRWLQMFASKQAFLVTFCIAWVLQGMYYTYFVSVITTIEKLFQIQSKTTGIIMSATEIGQIGSSLLLTYYGGQGHRPKWIAWGMVLFSVSSFTCAVPHFVFGRQLIEANDVLYMGVASVSGAYGRGNSSDTVGNICRADDMALPNNTCEAWSDDRRLHSKHTTIVLAIFFISLLGVGMGQTAVYTLGIPYIDDNVASRESPLYFAITIGVRILGPALGFLLGSMCTRIYADPYSDPQISPTDPRWVGAWWLGLVLVSSLLMLSSFAMFAFPKRLRSSRHPPRALRTGRKNPSLRDFPKAVKRLLKNDILMFRTASSVLHILPIAGLYTFLPKYLESQFRLPAYEANMISGVGGILVMGLGIIISGVFILRVKPNARFVAAWIAFTAVVYAIGMGILMFIGCPMDDFAGLQAGRTPSFEPVCESNCQCDKDKFGPICGDDHKTYFSACHAGCRNVTILDGKITEFSDCQCMKDPLSNVTLAEKYVYEFKAKRGLCDSTCKNFVWYILLFSVFVFIHSTSEVGSMLLILRCVDPRDKAMALGLIQFAIGLFGNVPCPIVYGAVVDYACMVWEEACGEKGACWLYDANIFRTFYHGTTGAILLCAFFVDIIVWYKAGSINFVDEPNQSAQEEELNPIAGRARSETSV